MPTLNGYDVPSHIPKEQVLMYFPQGILGLRLINIGESREDLQELEDEERRDLPTEQPVFLEADGSLRLKEKGRYVLRTADSRLPPAGAGPPSFHHHHAGYGPAAGSYSTSTNMYSYPPSAGIYREPPMYHASGGGGGGGRHFQLDIDTQELSLNTHDIGPSSSSRRSRLTSPTHRYSYAHGEGREREEWGGDRRGSVQRGSSGGGRRGSILMMSAAEDDPGLGDSYYAGTTTGPDGKEHEEGRDYDGPGKRKKKKHKRRNSGFSLPHFFRHISPPDENVSAVEKESWVSDRRTSLYHFIISNMIVFACAVLVISTDMWLTCDCFNMGLFQACIKCVKVSIVNSNNASDVFRETQEDTSTKCTDLTDYHQCNAPNFVSLRIVQVIHAVVHAILILIIFGDCIYGLAPPRPFYILVFVLQWSLLLSILVAFGTGETTAISNDLSQVQCLGKMNLEDQLVFTSSIANNPNLRASLAVEARDCHFGYGFWVLLCAWVVFFADGAMYFYQRYNSWAKWGERASDVAQGKVSFAEGMGDGSVREERGGEYYQSDSAGNFASDDHHDDTEEGEPMKLVRTVSNSVLRGTPDAVESIRSRRSAASTPSLGRQDGHRHVRSLSNSALAVEAAFRIAEGARKAVSPPPPSTTHKGRKAGRTHSRTSSLLSNQSSHRSAASSSQQQHSRTRTSPAMRDFMSAQVARRASSVQSPTPNMSECSSGKSLPLATQETLTFDPISRHTRSPLSKTMKPGDPEESDDNTVRIHPSSEDDEMLY